jgi:hypothetical protein
MIIKRVKKFRKNVKSRTFKNAAADPAHPAIEQALKVKMMVTALGYIQPMW